MEKIAIPERLKAKNVRKNKKDAERIRNKKIDELEDLEKNIKFVARKIRFWEKPNSNK